MKILLLVLLVALAGCEFYSLSREFQVSGQVAADELAHATYEDLLQKTGWNRLYIYTNKMVTPIQQHQAAGFLQGYATYNEIWDAFNNLIRTDFLGNTYAPPVVENFLEQQVNYMDLMVDLNRDDPFWTYIGYYLAQLRYMHAGYLTRIKRQRLPQMKLEFQQFYYLTSAGDLEDLISLDTGQISDRKNCDIYIRLEGKKLYYSHHTHNSFTETLRIFKTWSFPREGVPTQTVSFTSRPGDLISKDDFILLSSGLGVFETSLQNYLKANYDDLRISTAPSWVRTVVANHLSHSPDEWIAYFNTSRSGTHNNQWFIVDPTALQRGSQAVVVFEEGFTVSARIDMTSQLVEKGYVASYNMPITQQVYDKLGYMFIGPETYQTDERAIAFRTLHPKMKTIDEMKYYLMNNDNQDSYCHGIAPRCDLDDKGYPFGVLDCKIATLDTISRNFIWAISGPTNSNGRFPPFDWRKWNHQPHDGLPTVYNFDWQAIPIDIEKPVGTTPFLVTE